MAEEKNGINIASAVKVADRVDLQSVKLLECDCRQQPISPKGKKAFDIEEAARFEINQEENIIGVFIQFALNAFGEGVEHKKENSFLNIRTTFLLLYKINSMEGLDDTAFRSFAELNGTYNAWPYWREFVQSITSRMELPTLTIPVFRISSLPSKKVANENVTPVKS